MHVDNLEALESLRPKDKIRHWCGKDPWEGIRLSHKTPIGPGEVGFDSLGNTTQIPEHVGKPCLGQMGAFARHGTITMQESKYGPPRATRCGRCSTRGACERTFNYRLSRNSEMSAAYSRFRGAGGALGLTQPTIHPEALPAFESFVRVLTRHGGFASVNDAYVKSYYVERRTELLAIDADRKQTERRKKLSAGQVDEGHIDLLLRYRTYRQGQFQTLMNDTAAKSHLPARLNRIPPATIRKTSDVWFARELLRAKRECPNPSSIAASMIAQWPEQYQHKESLRGRVKTDLLRIHALEQLVLPGRSAPVWERFDIAKAIAEDEFTTYGVSP